MDAVLGSRRPDGGPVRGILYLHPHVNNFHLLDCPSLCPFSDHPTDMSTMTPLPSFLLLPPPPSHLLANLPPQVRHEGTVQQCGSQQAALRVYRLRQHGLAATGDALVDRPVDGAWGGERGREGDPQGRGEGGARMSHPVKVARSTWREQAPSVMTA